MAPSVRTLRSHPDHSFDDAVRFRMAKSFFLEIVPFKGYSLQDSEEIRRVNFEVRYTKTYRLAYSIRFVRGPRPQWISQVTSGRTLYLRGCGEIVVPGGGVEPPRAEARRILSPTHSFFKPSIFISYMDLRFSRRVDL